MKIKKIILILVEGLNDEKELAAIFHIPRFAFLNEKYALKIVRMNKDLTADTKCLEKNIIKYVNDAVSHFLHNGSYYGFWNGIREDDIQEVIQIVDMDGAFIPSSCIVRGEDSKFYYEENRLITSNVDGAKGRNKKKAAILRRLISTSKVLNRIPYSIYYVSRDMDHVLFNNRNSSDEEKRNNRELFRQLCSRNPEILNESLFKEGIMASGSFVESWDFIQQGCNSLNRYTNINLFFGDSAKNPK